jgi:hypothetical protein
LLLATSWHTAIVTWICGKCYGAKNTDQNCHQYQCGGYELDSSTQLIFSFPLIVLKFIDHLPFILRRKYGRIVEG